MKHLVFKFILGIGNRLCNLMIKFYNDYKYILSFFIKLEIPLNVINANVLVYTKEIS